MSNNGDNGKSRFTTRNKYDEFYRLNFLQSEKGAWLAQFDKPLPINIPIEQQEVHLMKHAYLCDCNTAFVKMYGYEDSREMIGIRFPHLFDNAEPANLLNLRSFLKEGYRIQNTGTIEIDKNGIRKYFLNDIVGVVENNCLVRVWGVQQDVTAEKSRIESERHLFKKMTPEQLQILKMTVDGKTMKEIAFEVGVSQKKVESVRNNLKVIFGVDTIAQLIATAILLGIQTSD